MVSITTEVETDLWRAGSSTELGSDSGPGKDSYCRGPFVYFQRERALSLQQEGNALTSGATPGDQLWTNPRAPRYTMRNKSSQAADTWRMQNGWPIKPWHLETEGSRFLVRSLQGQSSCGYCLSGATTWYPWGGLQPAEPTKTGSFFFL